MNRSLFSDWIEQQLFGQGELAHIVADIIDEAIASDTLGVSGEGESEGVDQALLRSAWEKAQDEDEVVRARVAVIVSELGLDDAVPALHEASQCDDTEVARAATIALAETKGVDEDLLSDLVIIVQDSTESRETRSAAVRAIAARNSTLTTQTLIRLARTDDPELARFGLEGLGFCRPKPDSTEHEAALDALVAALEKKDPLVKSAAAQALGHFGDPEAIAPLEEVLIEKDATLRRRAVFALARLGAESARGPLARMLNDFSVPARWEIVDVIADCYGESMLDELERVLRDSDPEVRDHLVRALGRIEGQRAAELLREIAVEDDDDFVREQAEAILDKRSDRPAEPREPVGAADLPQPPAPPEFESPQPPPPPGREEPAPTFQPHRPAAGRQTVHRDQPAPGQPVHPVNGVRHTGRRPLRPLFGAGPQPRRSLANVVEVALDEMNCSWWRSSDGYEVKVAVPDGEVEVTILVTEADFEGSRIYRFLIDCGPADRGAYEAALLNNRDLDYGSLAVEEDENGDLFFVLTDTLPATGATVDGIRKSIMSLVCAAGELGS